MCCELPAQPAPHSLSGFGGGALYKEGVALKQQSSAVLPCPGTIDLLSGQSAPIASDNESLRASHHRQSWSLLLCSCMASCGSGIVRIILLAWQVIIFDWDDTLLCSSAINAQQWKPEQAAGTVPIAHIFCHVGSTDNCSVIGLFYLAAGQKQVPTMEP